MVFNTSSYGFFLVAVFTLFWVIAGRRRERNLLLLLASWFFYACWDWRYLGLIWLSTILDWYVGAGLGATDPGEPGQRRRRRLLLLASLAGNLGILGLFKYHGFFVASLEDLLGGLTGGEVVLGDPFAKVLLPVGISFYTFQTLSYTIDVYRGQLAPCKRFEEFALFVAFFPQLVAGPIVRAVEFLPQLDKEPWLDRHRLLLGLSRIADGLFKKVVVADVLGKLLVEPTFAEGSQVSGLHALLGVYGYALQIYGDFSGYSDIAIGSALLLGFRIPENFNAPYLARSIQDFWHRWHMSLSRWLRDYLYVPLGGNRKGPRRTYVNLMLTMLLGGLWHGAGWQFVAWGGLHGVWLAINRWWQRRGLPWFPGAFGRLCGILLTFHLVCLAWVFFRAEGFARAVDLLHRIVEPGVDGWATVPAQDGRVWFALAAGYVLHAIPRPFGEALRERWISVPALVHGAFWGLFFGLLAYCAVEGGPPFIYFQF